MNEVATVFRITNGYVITLNEPNISKVNATASRNMMYFKEPQELGQAFATLLAKQKLTANEPRQLDMFADTTNS